MIMSQLMFSNTHFIDRHGELATLSYIPIYIEPSVKHNKERLV